MASLTNPTPTTTLDAVNSLLASIGEAPVTTITGNRTSDVALAVQKLTEVNVEVQTEGWDFNTDEDFPLVPDETGEIKVGSDTLAIDVSKWSRTDVNPVMRGSRLYDKKNRTYTFTKKVLVDRIVALPFEDLPQAARWFVTVRAGRRFQQQTAGSAALDRFTADMETSALTALAAAEARSAQHTVFDNPFPGRR